MTSLSIIHRRSSNTIIKQSWIHLLFLLVQQLIIVLRQAKIFPYVEHRYLNWEKILVYRQLHHIPLVIKPIFTPLLRGSLYRRHYHALVILRSIQSITQWQSVKRCRKINFFVQLKVNIKSDEYIKLLIFSNLSLFRYSSDPYGCKQTEDEPANKSLNGDKKFKK